VPGVEKVLPALRSLNMLGGGKGAGYAASLLLDYDAVMSQIGESRR